MAKVQTDDVTIDDPDLVKEAEGGDPDAGDNLDATGDEGDDDTGEDDPEGEGAEGEGEGGEGADSEGGELDEVVVTIGDEPADSTEDEGRAPEWVRELRKSNREKDRRIRELEQKVASAAPAPAAVVVGAKPTLESCEFDPEKFETELEAWHARKSQADAEAAARKKTEDDAKAAWETKVNAYKAAQSTLKVRDFEDAEATARDTLSVMQQGIILQGMSAEAAATMVYALGKNPKKAKELAAIADPVQFAFAVAKLETQLKVTPRKKVAPAPERKLSGNVAGSAAIDKTLERLREEAQRTGDLSKVQAYNREQRRKQAA